MQPSDHNGGEADVTCNSQLTWFVNYSNSNRTKPVTNMQQLMIALSSSVAHCRCLPAMVPAGTENGFRRLAVGLWRPENALPLFAAAGLWCPVGLWRPEDALPL